MSNISFTGSVSIGAHLEETQDKEAVVGFYDSISAGLRYDFLPSESPRDTARSNVGITTSARYLTGGPNKLSLLGELGIGSSRTNAGMLLGSTLSTQKNGDTPALAVGLIVHPIGFTFKNRTSLATGPEFIFLNTPSENSTNFYAGWALEW